MNAQITRLPILIKIHVLLLHVPKEIDTTLVQEIIAIHVMNAQVDCTPTQKKTSASDSSLHNVIVNKSLRVVSLAVVSVNSVQKEQGHL